MRTLIHHSPAGALEIAGILGPVEPGEPFDVPDELAESLLLQTDLYAEVITGVPLESLTPAELRALAAEWGIEVPARATKKKLLELIEAAPSIPLLGDPDDQADPATEPASADDQQGEPQ